MKISLICLCLALLFSCKTREDIEREAMVTTMSRQMEDGQKIQADVTSRIQFLEERLSKVTGQVEEADHRTAQTLESRIKGIEERLVVIEASVKTNDEKLVSLEGKFSKQSKYIGDVLKTLKGISSPKRNTKTKNLSPYDRAMANYRAGKYKTARRLMLPLLNAKGMRVEQKTRILHNLGMMEFMSKKDNEAVVYFSRLFTEYPKSSYNKNGLFMLAKSFIRQKKNAEAKQTLGELKKRYPKSKQSKEATKLLKKL